MRNPLFFSGASRKYGISLFLFIIPLFLATKGSDNEEHSICSSPILLNVCFGSTEAIAFNNNRRVPFLVNIIGFRPKVDV
jgi:hypothetical protein